MKPPVKTYCGGKPNYCLPVDEINITQECVDKNKKCKCEWRGLSQKELLTLWVAGIPRMSKERYIQIAQQVEQYLKEKNA